MELYVFVLTEGSQQEELLDIWICGVHRLWLCSSTVYRSHNISQLLNTRLSHQFNTLIGVVKEREAPVSAHTIRNIVEGENMPIKRWESCGVANTTGKALGKSPFPSCISLKESFTQNQFARCLHFLVHTNAHSYVWACAPKFTLYLHTCMGACTHTLWPESNPVTLSGCTFHVVLFILPLHCGGLCCATHPHTHTHILCTRAQSLWRPRPLFHTDAQGKTMCAITLSPLWNCIPLVPWPSSSMYPLYYLWCQCPFTHSNQDYYNVLLWQLTTSLWAVFNIIKTRHVYVLCSMWIWYSRKKVT